MKRIILILTLLSLFLVSCEEDIALSKIGGEDGPTKIIVAENV